MFLKENDLSKLKEFIATKKPHVVAVTAESKEALRIVEEVQRLIQELTEEAEMPAINVELVDNEVAMVYENSNKGQVSHGVQKLQQRAGKSQGIYNLEMGFFCGNHNLHSFRSQNCLS